MEKVAVRPARHYRHSPELATTVRGTHGYQASCTCGWYGGVRDSYRLAVWEARWHGGTEHTANGEGVDVTLPNGATD